MKKFPVDVWQHFIYVINKFGCFVGNDLERGMPLSWGISKKHKAEILIKGAEGWITVGSEIREPIFWKGGNRLIRSGHGREWDMSPQFFWLGEEMVINFYKMTNIGEDQGWWLTKNSALHLSHFRCWWVISIDSLVGGKMFESIARREV